MSNWKLEYTERKRYYTKVTGCSVVLANGAGVKVNSVSVTYERKVGQPWGKPRVSVSHGKGWDLTVTRVPGGLRGAGMPVWLAELVAEVRP